MRTNDGIEMFLLFLFSIALIAIGISVIMSNDGGKQDNKQMVLCVEHGGSYIDGDCIFKEK